MFSKLKQFSKRIFIIRRWDVIDKVANVADVANVDFMLIHAIAEWFASMDLIRNWSREREREREGKKNGGKKLETLTENHVACMSSSFECESPSKASAFAEAEKKS